MQFKFLRLLLLFRGGVNLSSDIFIFKRVEKKYFLSPQQVNMLMKKIGHLVKPDDHGESTICSLYLDTPDNLLIRNSIDAKAYKEKLRLRSYGTPQKKDRVFLEIKKKLNGVVYKRRVALPLEEAMDYIFTLQKPFDSQIMREIDYAMNFYNHPKPKMLVAYRRMAYFAEDIPGLRITFDSEVRYRTTDLELDSGDSGTKILPDDVIIMEIKTGGAMPVWLSRALDECKIFPRSFSKYGTAYKQTLTK